MKDTANTLLSNRTARAIFALAAILLAGLFAARGVGAQGASDEIRILSMVEANHRHLTLLDICDPTNLGDRWKGIFSQVSLGEAPSVGSTKTADGPAIRDFITRLLESRRIDPATVRMSVPDKIQITRLAVTITQEKIEEIFRQHIREHAKWAQDEMEIQKVTFSGLPVVPAGDLNIEVAVGAQERYAGNVCVTYNIFVDGEKVRTLSVAGRVEIYQKVVQAAHPLRQNQVVAPGDLETARVNVTDNLDRYATDADQLVNMRLLRNVGVHQAIGLKDLDKPLVLKRGTMVTMIYSQPGLKVTAKGQAREDGSIGDTVRINNVVSNRVVYCRVIDAETVHVSR